MSQCKPRISKCGGFTLVEVLAAVLLLSVGLMAVVAATSAARETQERSVFLAIGRNVAQSRIEALRSESVDMLGYMIGESTDGTLPLGNKIIVSASPYPSSTEPDLWLAQVTVSWPEGEGVRTIRYETLITRKL